MAKIKNKKSKNLADAYAKKRKQQQITKKTPTPFEIHVNKDKQRVLGKKSKADKGLPGIARSKAIMKRKNTLLHEYKVKDKDNIFLDRRIGEKNIHMTQEDKAMARFAREKIKAHNKKNIFNLNDDEVLTHRGQTLMDIEKYDDPKSDDDSDDDKDGKLDKKFVADAHFGGGMLSKPNSEMSRKDLIDQLIEESKKRKAERQKIREQTIDLTEKLDSEWRDLLPLVNSSHKIDKSVPEEKTAVDDYDKAMRELKFEARGNPTDKLKSEEVIAKEEEEKLEKLEQDRLIRMQGFKEEEDRKSKHRSADDLDDFHIEKIEERSDNEEESNLKGILKKKDNEKTVDENYEDDEDEEDSNEDAEESEEEKEENDDDDDDNDDDDDDDDDDGNDNDGNDNEDAEESEKEEGEINDREESEKVVEDEKVNQKANVKTNENNEINNTTGKEDSNEESDDDLSDLKASESESDEENAFSSVKKSITIKKATEFETNIKLTENSKSTITKNSQPKLEEKIEQLDINNCSLIIDKVLKGSNWRLIEKNREKALNLFSYMIQYIDKRAALETTEDFIKFFGIFERLSPHLYDLAHADPLGTKEVVHDILKKKHDEFESNIKTYPGLDTLILFKLVSLLYPTSDFRHPIVTPCLIFMSQILLRCKLRKKQDISKGLFICTLILEYNLLSKRWSPEAINFLRGVIYVSLPKPFNKIIKVVPPFKTIGEISSVLVLKKDHSKADIDIESIKMQTKDLVEDTINDDFKIRTFISAVNLLSEFKKLSVDLDAEYSIFEPILDLFKVGSTKRYPQKIKEEVETLVNDLEKLKEKKLEPLAFEKKRPKALRMYEPKIEVVREGKKHRPMSKEKAEREKLLHKLKMEKKSALREVRRDNAFISKVRLKEQLSSDAERKRKVKEIFGDAAEQQHELKKFRKK